MKKKRILIFIIYLVLCFCLLIGCDPVYPPGSLKVVTIDTLIQGKTIEIEIIYPNTGGSIVFGWRNQNIEIINGHDIISVSNLMITGLKPGTARIKVSATTEISVEALKAGYEEKVYSTEVDIKVG